MARLHHVSIATIVAERPRGRLVASAPATWKASHPVPHGAVEPWFQLTARAPLVDTRVGNGSEVGIAASLETFGGVAGPTAGATGHAETWPAVLGGQPVAPGTPAPPGVEEFLRHSHARVALEAEGLSSGRQCLLVAAVRALGPSERAALQVFVGTAFVGEDQVQGEDRLAVLLDVPDHGELAVDLRLRLVGDLRSRVAIHGVTGHLL